MNQANVDFTGEVWKFHFPRLAKAHKAALEIFPQEMFRAMQEATNSLVDAPAPDAIGGLSDSEIAAIVREAVEPAGQVIVGHRELEIGEEIQGGPFVGSLLPGPPGGKGFRLILGPKKTS